ncbi:HAMP domain-containing protein [Sphingomonas suaedae]|uniref:HAMP domain-containing protein n=1 Tax=Sphingomonas suaedae TaxID=2599297 RepID=A0A518RBK3_9SPHN|nr:methyl-accepting chemotaxis protein [Sphingomonas suaedae]QDX24850.1 HAMP domain-containing protein [Sphingomonas suaedae]
MFSRLKLATKITLLSCLAMLALAASLVMVTQWALNQDMQKRAAERQETNMGVAREVLGRYGKTFAVDGDRLLLDGRPLNGFNAPVDRVKQLVGGTATIFLGDTRIATNVMKDDGSRAVGTKLAPGPVFDAVLRDGKPYRGQADILGKSYFTAYDPIRDASGKTVGVLYVGIPVEDVAGNASGLLLILEELGLAALLIGCAVQFVISRRLFAPITAMIGTMRRLADGDTNSEIVGSHRADEIGEMARALAVLQEASAARAAAEAEIARNKDALDKVVRALGDGLKRVAQGKLTHGIDAEFDPQYAALRADFNATVVALQELVGAVIESTVAIKAGTGEISSATDDLARRSESNAASIEETTAAITQINTRLEAMARAARDVVARAEEASSVVEDGRNTAEHAVATMGRVSDSARGIDGVIEGLDKIAFQTRVLAMNAAVEAGRAGEAGRGFAVVADLVSALAMRAEEEAKRAREQLTLTQDEVAVAVEAVRSVDGALARIVETVGSVNGLVGTMAADNGSQSAAMTEIAAAVGTMDHSTQQNAAMIEETSAAARGLLAQVNALADQASRFDAGPRAPISAQRASAGAPAPVASPTVAAEPLQQPPSRPKPVRAKAKPASGPKTAPLVRPTLPVAANGNGAVPAAAAMDDWDEF